MYLKKVEIAGFKSFADRTSIEFDTGVTAVVGPNGSGKSNITEAIRWVLGEQSAKNLRGGKMPDVIFAGSDTRKALNRAEVTVVLDNSERYLPLDFNEVSITRRFTRSGESDFYINKQRCRLKDITELFMDSGLGKESFSIISQGKVESIFNSKAEDRRGIFEEAAGVLKYKQRKKQAEQKLFETEDNLNRVQDIVYELENQMLPLENQSQKANTFLSIKEQLAQVEVSVSVAEIDQLKTEWETNKMEIEQFHRKMTRIKEEKKESEQLLQQLYHQRQNVDLSIDQNQKQLLQVTESYEQAEGQKNVLMERHKNSTFTTKEYQQNLHNLVDKKEKLFSEITILQQKQKENQQEQHMVQEKLKELEAVSLSYQKSTKERLEELRAQYVDLMQTQANTRNELKHLERMYQQETQRNQKDMIRYQELIEKQQMLTEQQQQLATDYQSASQKKVSLQEEYQELYKSVEQKKAEIIKKEKQMFEAMAILQQVKARQKSLQEVQENYAGFYQGVRAILKEKEQLNGIVGAVAELIQVPKELVVSVETALGSAAQNIIVENEKSGQAGITYLKKQRLGRATFLPLSIIKPRVLPERFRMIAQEVPGFIGVASEQIQYPEKIQNVIQNILGMTLLAKDLTSANELAKAVQYQYRVVSLDGDVMSPGGAMTGGANKKGNQGSLFSQSNELEELSIQIAKMSTQLESYEKTVRILKQNLLVVEQQLEEIRLAGEQSRLTEQELKNRQNLLDAESIQLSKEKQIFEYDSRELQQFLKQYEVEKTKWTKELVELEEHQKQLDLEMEELSQSEKDNEDKKEEFQKQIQKIQEKKAVLDEQKRHFNSQVLDKNQQLQEYVNEIQSIEAQLVLLNTDQTTHYQTQESIIEKMQKLQEEKQKLQEQITQNKAAREVIQEKTTKLDKQLLILNKEQQEVTNQKATAEIIKNRSEMEIDAHLKYLQEEYQLTYEASRTQFSLVSDLSVAKEKIKLYKKQIEELGPINLNAIEQYDQVKERYQFLVEQKEDLLIAKGSLFDTMNEMDEVVKERFLEVFEDIRKEFVMVFPAMFGGGHADLCLTNPQDLLQTGIDIIAQPPGKKLQNLSLLSGGERALTAIALLFAIIQVRPVPFCILDEVEAALDEANVARFGHYLSKFEKETQFIVITHRKGTMEAADVLYGVTMQESGVSKMVSVRLEEVNQNGDIQ